MTNFHIARTPRDYKACHELLDRMGIKERTPLSRPTIYGERDGKIVGFIATAPAKKMRAIMIGEMGLDPQIKRPVHLAVKLVEAYENVLRNLGIVSYLFCIPIVNTKWLEQIEQVAGIKPYAKDSKLAWFNRRIG